MLRKFEAWETEDCCALFESASLEEMRANPAMKLLKKPHEFDAATTEEASSIHNLRMGFGPYQPMGAPEPCPKCGAWFYPEGGGECWRCGLIC